MVRVLFLFYTLMTVSVAFASAASIASGSGVDCTNAYEVLTAQMDDMQAGSTQVAFRLASPGNRASTASPGGCNTDKFDKMVRNPTYMPLLGGFGYRVAGFQISLN